MTSIWEEEFGQDEAFGTLQKIYESNRIPHAFLFSGMEGVGKHYTAVQFAQILNGNLPDEKKTTVLSKIRSLSEPYIKYIFPLPRGRGESGDDSPFEKLSQDLIEQIHTKVKTKSQNPFYNFKIESANNIKINSIRDIRKFISLNYDEIDYRFIFIDNAHLMNDESQNALLKSLEEPPPGIIFILFTSQPEQLLPTIISRCWKINFKPLPKEIIKDILQKYFHLDSQSAKKVSYFAEGSVESAIKLIEKDFEKIIDNAINILRYSLAGRYNTAFKILNNFIEDSPKESVKTLINLILRWLNDTVKKRNDLDDYYFEEYSETLDKFNEKFSSSDVVQIFKNLEKLSTLMDRNTNLNIIAMNIIFEIASIAVR